MLREQSVTLGVDFLSHPNVVSHSREDKTSFLRGKGLTGEEIDEAFKRVEPQPQAPQGQPQAPQGHFAPQPAYYPPAVVEEESWGSFLLNSIIPASLAVSSGASLLYFYKNYVLHENGLPSPPPQLLPGTGMLQPPPFMPEQSVIQPNPVAMATGGVPWRPQPLPGAITPTPTAADFLEATAPTSPPSPSSSSDSQLLRDTLEALKETVGLLKQQQQQPPVPQGDLQASLPVILQAMQSSSEVKAELSAIKSLLLASLIRSAGPAGVPATTTTASDGLSPDLIQSLLNVQPVAAATEPQVDAATSPTTATPESPDSSSPTPSEKEDAADKQIEERLVKAREALAEMVASCDKLDAEVTNGGYGMVVMFIKNLLKDAMNPRYRRIAKGNANYSKLLQPLVGHKKFLEAVGFEERGGSFEFCNDWTQNLQEQSNGFARQVLASSVANLESIREQSKGGASSPTAAPPSETPSYPMSFEEIIRLQKEGKRPEGIKDIPNDRLSQDAPSKPVLQQPVKPWELSKPKVSIQQVPDEEDGEEQLRSPILE
ncbi:hypothetical protein BASA81_008265 [Batrachochytrium salamandrivorans]|nr:hypothetical protein BASA81_008265 [Batrachochytrium salamandrivorans]